MKHTPTCLVFFTQRKGTNTNPAFLPPEKKGLAGQYVINLIEARIFFAGKHYKAYKD